jgi:serine/threonine protein kinase/tetratricopeptide (TPR) repeat protein
MVGEKISHYRLTGHLGKGGMGEVYEAVDELLGRHVAMKFPTSDIASPGQLAKEARAASQLNHPNVAQIYEFGVMPDGGAFIAMELVRGQTLRQVLAKGPLPVEETLRIVRAVAAALEEAHQHGIVHLDIKPANIALTERGVVKVLDFGLARRLPRERSDERESTQTIFNVWGGTPAYMSPEQAKDLPLDRRSDLFSLGCVLFECLTGRHAFQGSTKVSTLLDVVSSDPLTTATQEVPDSLKPVLRRLLAKNREDRYESATELLADLEPATTTPPPAGGPKRLRKRTMVMAAITLAAVATAALWFTPLRPFRSGKPRIDQVAVLPFENLSHQPDQDAFCEGLLEVVTSLLSHTERFGDALWVLPSSDVRRFNVQTVADANRTFHPNLVVNGSVRRTAGGYTIAVNLSDPASPRLLRSRTVQVTDGEAGELEPKLTEALIDLLRVGPKSQPKPGRTDAGAYAQFVEGRGYLAQWQRGDNLKRAVDALEKSAARDPRFAPVLIELGSAYYRMYSTTHRTEWLAKADQAERKALEIEDTGADVHVQLGRILRATGQIGEATRELETALAREPQNLTALLQLAGAYESDKRTKDAEQIYLKAIRQRPSYFPAHTNLGILYMSQGQYGLAEEHLSLVVALAPEQADPHTTLGTLYYHLDRLDEAEREFTASIKLRPTATAYANRCAVDFSLVKIDAAIADCRKSVELDSANAMAWGNLADALAERPARIAEANDLYKKAIDAGNRQLAINPNNAELLSRMALYASKIRQPKLATQLAEQALTTGATRVSVLYKAAKAFGFSGDCGRALDLMKQALEQGYSQDEARRDPDLKRLRAASPACAVPLK